MKNTMSRTAIALAATLFAASAPSLAMAQSTGIGGALGGGGIEDYNGPSNPSSHPVQLDVNAGHVAGTVFAGKGDVGGGAGTVHGNHVRALGVEFERSGQSMHLPARHQYSIRLLTFDRERGTANRQFPFTFLDES